MINLKSYIWDKKEEKFSLESRDFGRLHLKQIGASIFHLKRNFTEKGAMKTVPTDLTTPLRDVNDALLKLFSDYSLSHVNIVIGTSLPSGSREGLMFLADSLAVVLNFPLSQKPDSVQCDVFIATNVQPVMVLTFITGDKETPESRAYNTSVTRSLTEALRKFTDESVNILSGVVCIGLLEDISRLETRILKIARHSSVGLPKGSLCMNPLKYDKILTAFWASVSETKSVMKKTDDGDYLHFLTTEQCVALVENINKKEVHLKYLPGCGATTLMVEVARRLSRLGETLLVCGSQEEADRIGSVLHNVISADNVNNFDVSSFENLVADAEHIQCTVKGRMWTFERVPKKEDISESLWSNKIVDTDIVMKRSRPPAEYFRLTYILLQIERKLQAGVKLSHEDNEDLCALHRGLDITKKRRDNVQKLINILSSDEKQKKLKHILAEMETVKLVEMCKPDLSSTYYWPPGSEPSPRTDRTLSNDGGDSGQGLDSEEQDLLYQLKHGILKRSDLFPILGGVMKRDKTRIAYLLAKTRFLKQVTNISLPKEYIQQESGDYIHSITKLSKLGITETGSGSEGQSSFTSLEKVNGIKKEVKTTKMETYRVEKEITEHPGRDHLTEWDYNMQYLSQQLASTRIQEFITDIIGQDDLPIPVGQAVAHGADMECIQGRPEKTRCHVHHLREFQYGNYRKRKQINIMSILKDIITSDKNTLSSLQRESYHLQNVYDCGLVYIVGEPDSPRSRVLCCPAMILNRERVYRDLAVLGDTELVNTEASGGHHHTDQFKRYRGTCSLPIPLSPSPSRYWETHTRLQVKKDVSGYGPLLEMGVTEEGQLDTGNWVSLQSRSSWAVCVEACNRQHPGICTMVWKDGSQVGECQTDTMSTTPGTDVTLKYGVVVDVARGRLSFIDLDREKVLHKFDVKFTQTIFPMFSVWPYPDEAAINMRLVSGSDIAMTDKKKSLIFTALS